MEKQLTITEQKIYIDLDGNNSESKKDRVLIEAGPYTGTFKSFNWILVPVYGSNKMPPEMEVQIIGQVEVHPLGQEVPLWLNPTITKSGNPKKSNSKLYDLLLNAGVLGSVEQDLSLEDLITFLEARLIGRRVSVVVKNSKSDNPSSRVQEVFKFLDVKA